MTITTQAQDNANRALRALNTINAHAISVDGYPVDLDDIETNIVDLLADLMHYMARHEIDFNDALLFARRNFNAEVKMQEATQDNA